MDKKSSEYIEDFLKFFRDAQTEYNIALQKESDAEKETQDILHWLEFHVDPDIRVDQLLNTGLNLGMVRQDRREAKDTEVVLKPVIEWLGEHKIVKKSLEQLLGSVRKAEKYVQNRHYIPKTEIMSEILEPLEAVDEDKQEE